MCSTHLSIKAASGTSTTIASVKKPTIICVDDEKIVLENLRLLLEQHWGDAYAVATASTGEAALTIAQELRKNQVLVTLVIAEQKLPGMKGDELLLALEALDSRIQKVMISGHATAAEVGNVVNRGRLFRYLPKPWNASELLQTVENAFQLFENELANGAAKGQTEQLIVELRAMNGNLEKRLEERTQAYNEKSRDLTSSLRYAKMIQRAILPNVTELTKTGFDGFVVFLPRDIVSGDFYWVWADEMRDISYFSVADSTGHGVPGALMSIVGISLLYDTVRELGWIEPDKILNGVRKNVIRVLKQKQNSQRDGIDAGLVMLDKKNKLAHFSGAFINLNVVRAASQGPLEVNGKQLQPKLEVNGKCLYILKGNRYPIAYFEHSNNDFSNASFSYLPGDEIFMSTDGFFDQFGGEKGRKHMRKRFHKLLLEVHGLETGLQRAKVKNSFIKWLGTYDQVDDVCVMGVKL